MFNTFWNCLHYLEEIDAVEGTAVFGLMYSISVIWEKKYCSFLIVLMIACFICYNNRLKFAQFHLFLKVSPNCANK